MFSCVISETNIAGCIIMHFILCYSSSITEQQTNIQEKNDVI